MSVESTIPVAVHGWTLSAWLLVVLNLIAGGFGVAAIKIWPKMRELGIGVRKNDMDELREEIAILRAEVAAQREIATKAGAQAHKSEMIVVTVVAAFQLAMGELEKLDPENKVLKQARDMMAIAMTGDFGMDQSIRRLSTVSMT